MGIEDVNTPSPSDIRATRQGAEIKGNQDFGGFRVGIEDVSTPSPSDIRATRQGAEIVDF